MPQIHRAGNHSVGLVSLNLDNQQAKTLEKYSTENRGASQRDVREVSVRALRPDSERFQSRGKLTFRTRTYRVPRVIF
jgi:hypothetical protein